MMQYKGFVGHAEYDDDAEIFHGEVINVNHVITFQGKTVAQLKKAFVESVDVYLDYCKKENIEPARPYSGNLVIRTTPELHRELSILARKNRKSLNTFICEKLQMAI
jgi:predicted HicB family RNase H-like nuclease